MRRAAVSLTNNIAEVYGKYHYQENIQFCRHSRGSLYELLEDLNVCEDQGYITGAERQQYRREALRVLKVLNCYIDSTKKLQQKEKG